MKKCLSMKEASLFARHIIEISQITHLFAAVLALFGKPLTSMSVLSWFHNVLMQDEKVIEY